MFPVLNVKLRKYILNTFLLILLIYYLKKITWTLFCILYKQSHYKCPCSKSKKKINKNIYNGVLKKFYKNIYNGF